MRIKIPLCLGRRLTSLSEWLFPKIAIRADFICDGRGAIYPSEWWVARCDTLGWRRWPARLSASLTMTVEDIYIDSWKVNLDETRINYKVALASLRIHIFLSNALQRENYLYMYRETYELEEQVR